MKSKNLCVHVTENGETKVKVSMSARAAGNLTKIVPEHLFPKLEARRINLDTMSRECVASEFAPGELFLLEEPGKSVRVWLE